MVIILLIIALVAFNIIYADSTTQVFVLGVNFPERRLVKVSLPLQESCYMTVYPLE